MKDEIAIAEEVNASQSDGGRLILGAICGQATAVTALAQSLAGNDYYTNPFASDDDEDDLSPTDIPDAQMELISAMKDSVKNLSAMVNMLYRAEATPGPADGDMASEAHVPLVVVNTPGMSAAVQVLVSESREKPNTVLFHEAAMGSTVTRGEVKGTMIQPGFNATRSRYYSREALKEAVDKKLWNGRQMFWDHNSVSGKRDLPERSVRDLAAVIRETYLQSDGSIGYRATLADPQMESKLTYMQEHGILGAMGVSINAAGQGAPAEVDGTQTFLVEHFVEAYTTDFVTTPGAGGSIDLLESDPAGGLTMAGDDEMDEKTMQAIMETMKTVVADAVKPLSEAQVALAERLEAVETQGKIAALIEAADLPARGKTQLLARFAEAKTTDGVAEAITEAVEYVAEIRGSAPNGLRVVNTEARRVGTSPVHGMGAQVEKGTAHKTIKDFSESRASALFGGAERTTKLLESMR